MVSRSPRKLRRSRASLIPPNLAAFRVDVLVCPSPAGIGSPRAAAVDGLSGATSHTTRSISTGLRLSRR
jgi:hypothetical protein